MHFWMDFTSNNFSFWTTITKCLIFQIHCTIQSLINKSPSGSQNSGHMNKWSCMTIGNFHISYFLANEGKQKFAGKQKLWKLYETAGKFLTPHSPEQSMFREWNLSMETKKTKQKRIYKGFQVITRLYFHFAKFLHQSQQDELLWEGETKQKTVLNRVSPKKL